MYVFSYPCIRHVWFVYSESKFGAIFVIQGFRCIRISDLLTNLNKFEMTKLNFVKFGWNLNPIRKLNQNIHILRIFFKDNMYQYKNVNGFGGDPRHFFFVNFLSRRFLFFVCIELSAVVKDVYSINKQEHNSPQFGNSLEEVQHINTSMSKSPGNYLGSCPSNSQEGCCGATHIYSSHNTAQLSLLWSQTSSPKLQGELSRSGGHLPFFQLLTSHR